MNQERIGKFIKEIREKEGLSQQKFAKKYGVTYQAVSKWENGKNLPDLSTLKKICSDYNMDLDSFLETKIPQNKKNKLSILIASIITIILILIIVLLIIAPKEDKDFQFKTLTTTCSNFKITGSVAYDDKKSSIYISHVDYCGGENTEVYSKIECTLYETDDKVQTEITKCHYKDNTDVTLEEFLKDVDFKANYEITCPVYEEANLHLDITATSQNGENITYKIPLKFEDDCK